jgi:hypothetical protein
MSKKKGLVANFGGKFKDSPAVIECAGKKIFLWKGRGDRIHIEADREVKITLPHKESNKSGDKDA